MNWITEGAALMNRPLTSWVVYGWAVVVAFVSEARSADAASLYQCKALAKYEESMERAENIWFTGSTASAPEEDSPSMELEVASAATRQGRGYLLLYRENGAPFSGRILSNKSIAAIHPGGTIIKFERTSGSHKELKFSGPNLLLSWANGSTPGFEDDESCDGSLAACQGHECATGEKLWFDWFGIPRRIRYVVGESITGEEVLEELFVRTWIQLDGNGQRLHDAEGAEFLVGSSAIHVRPEWMIEQTRFLPHWKFLKWRGTGNTSRPLEAEEVLQENLTSVYYLGIYRHQREEAIIKLNRLEDNELSGLVILCPGVPIWNDVELEALRASGAIVLLDQRMRLALHYGAKSPSLLEWHHVTENAWEVYSREWREE